MNTKQEKIINTAIGLFANQGVKKTTMDEIAQCGNVSKVTIYKYFSDKDGLCFGVGKYILDDCIHRLKNASQGEGAIQNKLYAVMEVITEFISRNKLSLCAELTRHNYKLQDVSDSFDAQFKGIIMNLITEGKQDGIILSDIDDEYIFHYVNMGISYFQNDINYRNKMLSNEVFRNEFMEFLLENIFTGQGE